jgi:transcriptional regulator with XRE-family HTH domain
MSRRSDPNHHTRAQTFGENLREARRAAGLSQEELAKRAGIDRPTISVYEHGKREPNMSTLVKLARALGVPAEALVRGL